MLRVRLRLATKAKFQFNPQTSTSQPSQPTKSASQASQTQPVNQRPGHNSQDSQRLAGSRVSRSFPVGVNSLPAIRRTALLLSKQPTSRRTSAANRRPADRLRDSQSPSRRLSSTGRHISVVRRLPSQDDRAHKPGPSGLLVRVRLAATKHHLGYLREQSERCRIRSV